MPDRARHTEHEQMLRRVADARQLPWLLPGALVVMVASAIGFRYADDQNVEVLCLFFGACAALVAFALWTSAAHFTRAAAATRNGRRVAASLTLRKDDDDAFARCGVLTLASDARAWAIVFAAPPDYEPQPGHYDVEAVLLSDVEWPVLVYLDDGLLWPRQTPRRVSVNTTSIR